MFVDGLRIDRDRISENSYLNDITAIRSLDELAFNKSVTFFVGENGSGKSTLLEAIAFAAGFNPEGGSKNYAFSTHDTHSELFEAISLIRGTRREKWGYFLRAESFFNVATMEEEYAEGSAAGSMRLHEMSHGESFLELMQEQFRSTGLFILDEPEAALSPQRQLSLLLEIARSRANGSQFIIATHLPILLGLPDAQILSFDGPEIHNCDYEDTDSYQITEMFINDRERLLSQLL